MRLNQYFYRFRSGHLMSRSFVTNMKYLLDKEGRIRESIPAPAKKLTEALGSIITFVTTRPADSATPFTPCWSTINRKRCKGRVDASIDLNFFDIVWHCLECGNHGSISQWQKTSWDRGHR
jgi:hypothetical protein